MKELLLGLALAFAPAPFQQPQQYEIGSNTILLTMTDADTKENIYLACKPLVPKSN